MSLRQGMSGRILPHAANALKAKTDGSSPRMSPWAPVGFFSRGGQIRSLGTKVPIGVQKWSPSEGLGAHKPTTGCENNA